MKILIIEDSKALLNTLSDGFRKMGYTVDAASNGHAGLNCVKAGDYDVIILDLMLPDIDGLTVLRNLRALGKKTNVLILSARDQVDDRVRGLQLGADDYMIKPFFFDELCARILTLTRRMPNYRDPEIRLGLLAVNTAMHGVRFGTTMLHLTPIEYSILEYLVLNRGKVISGSQISEAVLGQDEMPGVNTIQVMMCNLRKKLRTAGGAEVVRTRRGYGYYVENGA